MTTWNDRLLPHPLLAPWTDDYPEATFTAQVPHAVINNGKQINLTIKYHLTSQSLRELISEGKAHYVSLVACAKTFSRNSYPCEHADDLCILDAQDFSEELKLTPYVVAKQPIDGFTSAELVEEITRFKPGGFHIPAGSILAVGNSTEVELEEGGSPFAVIDLVADNSVGSGTFKVDLDDNRIKVYMAPGDKDQIEALRQHGEQSWEMAVLFPSIYLHAISEALRHLAYYPENRWARTMQRALERHNIAVDDDELKANALTHAQTLMERPVGTLMKALSREEEG